MKHFNRLSALLLALCLLPAAAMADTFLPEGETTHVDFKLGASVHADAFPATTTAHVADWETFASKLGIRGSMDALAFLTPTSRVYVDGAVTLNGSDAIPFTYDGYHSYRYLVTPALSNTPIFFQMHNFFEFMLKPYYFMDLPTEYLALLMYPEASYYIGDSYYTPLAQMIAEGEAAYDQEQADAAAEAEAEAEAAAEEAARIAEEAAKAAEEVAATVDAASADATEAAATVEPTVEPTAEPTEAPAEDGTKTFVIPYETLYEKCEELDLLVNDDADCERVYFYFTSLLTQIYASDMTVDALAYLEGWLDYLDPEQQGMTVVKNDSEMTCTIGEHELFMRTTDSTVDTLNLRLPNEEGYELAFSCAKTGSANGAGLAATLTVTQDGAESIRIECEGEGLPCKEMTVGGGATSGAGKLTFTLSGSTFGEGTIAPIGFTFDWSQSAAEKPYDLAANVSWVHPETGKEAISLHFSGKFSTVDKSVFVEASYPQNDFFNLNSDLLDEYKAQWLPTITLSALPIVLETPSGVINDLYQLMKDKGILLALGE